jgi:hypothetical protein
MEVVLYVITAYRKNKACVRVVTHYAGAVQPTVITSNNAL